MRLALALVAALAAPAAASSKPPEVNLVDYAAVASPETVAAAEVELDVRPRGLAASPARGALPLAVGDLSASDHDAFNGGVAATDEVFRNPMSMPLRRALEAASADGMLADGAGRTQVAVTSATTLMRCVNSREFGGRCIVTIDLAGTATPPDGPSRPIVVSAERSSRWLRNRNMARVIALVGTDAANAFAKAAAPPAP